MLSMERTKEKIKELQDKLLDLHNWTRLKELVAHERFNVRIEVEVEKRAWDSDRVTFDLDGIGVPREFAEQIISEKVRILNEELDEMMRQ